MFPNKAQMSTVSQLHMTWSRTLPYSIKNVKNICKECSIHQQVKPQYYPRDNVQLIKATQPFERISVDFKGFFPSRKTPFLLTIVDEYSRFPFTFPVKNIATSTVIKCLGNLFSIFGMPGHVHSNRGPCFINDELKAWLFSNSIASSCTTLYNPTDNGQVKRYNSNSMEISFTCTQVSQHINYRVGKDPFWCIVIRYSH